MSQELKSDERIILMVDPFTKEHFVFNHTRYGVAEMDGEINAGQDEDGKVWDHGEIVRRAQHDFVEADGSAILVTSTDNYDYSDKWHYDTKGYIDLGQKFAEAIYHHTQ